MSDSILCRADLARVLARADANSVDFVAQLLNLRTPRRKPTDESHSIAPRVPAPAVPAPEFPWPEKMEPARFWRAKKLTIRKSLEDSATVEREPEQDTARGGIQWTNRPQQATEFRPLATWDQVGPRLRKSLSRRQRSGPVDVALLVNRVAKIEYVVRIPRVLQRRWGTSVYLLQDMSSRLTCYFDDHDLVVDRLRRLIPEKSLHHLTCTDPQANLALWTPDGQRQTLDSARIPSGSVVICLSDLGTLELQGRIPGAALQRSWLNWGRHLRDNQVHLLALVPNALDRVSRDLQRVFAPQPWVRAVASGTHRDAQRQVRRLLQMIAPAVRLEPGLLRAIRLSSAEFADPALESWVWQDEAIASSVIPLRPRPILNSRRRCSPNSNGCRPLFASKCSPRCELIATTFRLKCGWMKSTD